MISTIVRLTKAAVALLEERAALGPAFTYCVVRQDMSIAQQMCQAVHAALLAGKDLSHVPHLNLALIGVPDEPTLRQVEMLMAKHAIQQRVFTEEDERYHTALCSEAIRDRRVRKILADLPWWTPIELGDSASYWRPGAK